MSWSDYVDAVQRKAAIANFHCDQLRLALADCKAPHDGRPDIATQAFLEGVVVAAVSAIDQVAQAANSALRLGLSSGNLFAGASPEIESRVPEFKEWREPGFASASDSDGPLQLLQVSNLCTFLASRGGRRQLCGTARAARIRRSCRSLRSKTWRDRRESPAVSRCQQLI